MFTFTSGPQHSTPLFDDTSNHGMPQQPMGHQGFDPSQFTNDPMTNMAFQYGTTLAFQGREYVDKNVSLLMCSVLIYPNIIYWFEHHVDFRLISLCRRQTLSTILLLIQATLDVSLLFCSFHFRTRLVMYSFSKKFSNYFSLSLYLLHLRTGQ